MRRSAAAVTSSLRCLLDAVVFSNLWMAAAAGALVAAASRGMGTAIRPEAVGLACAGTLLVYNIDRLRDLHRDQHASRDRSAFVTEHEGRLIGLCGAAAAASLFFGARAGWLAALMLLPVLGVGLFHRRLKRFENAKIVYIAASWTCVGFGLPAVLAPDAREPPLGRGDPRGDHGRKCHRFQRSRRRGACRTGQTGGARCRSRAFARASEWRSARSRPPRPTRSSPFPWRPFSHWSVIGRPSASARCSSMARCSSVH